MKDLIDRGIYREKMLQAMEDGYLDEDTVDTMVNILDCEPTVCVDSSVSCKDCVFAEHYENTAGAVECKHPKYSFEYGIGYVFHPIVPGEHFCGYAEREGTE